MKTDRTRLLGHPPIIPRVCQGEGFPGMVSVLIPTYNRAYIIAASIDSVLAQTYQNVEIVVVDDGSTDDTPAVLEKYGSRIRYIFQQNAGLAAARNTGLAAARGEYIAFQDSDDIWLPNKLEMQMAVMREHPELSLVWTDMTSIDPGGNVVHERHLRKGYRAFDKFDIDEVLPVRGKLGDLLPSTTEADRNASYRYGDIHGAMALGNLVHPPTVLLRRSHVERSGGLDLTFNWTCEDYEFLWRACAHGPAALIEEPSMLYRIEGADQLTRPDLLLYVARGFVTALERHLANNRRTIDLPRKVLNAHLAESFGWLGKEEVLAEQGDRRRARRYLCKSLRYSPWQPRLFAFVAATCTPRSWFESLRALKRMHVSAV